MNLSTLAKPDPRIVVPCTDLPSTIAKLEKDGMRVLAMDRKREIRSGATTYLLTAHPKSCMRSFKP